MIEIETFLKDTEGKFTSIDACQTPPPDPDYIEGAIRLSIDGLEIIGLEEWDYVDQLWCYIAEMSTKLRSSGYADTYFPDQPIKLAFQASGHRTLVTATVGKKSRAASVPSTVLLDAIKSAGVNFFDNMSRLTPTNSYAEALRELSL